MTNVVAARKSFWPWGILLTLLVGIAVNIYLLMLSLQTRLPLVEQSPYERGVNYQQEIDRAQALVTAGIQHQIEFSPTGHLVLTLVTRDGAPYTGASVFASVVHAATAGNDWNGDLKEIPTESGRYFAALPSPALGAWILVLAVKREDLDGIIREQVVVR